MHCDSLAGLHVQQQTIRQCDYPLPLFFQFVNISLDRVTCATAAEGHQLARHLHVTVSQGFGGPRSSSSRICTCTCIINHFFSLTDTPASASAILLQQIGLTISSQYCRDVVSPSTPRRTHLASAIERTSYHLWHNRTDFEASMRQHAYRLLLLPLLLLLLGPVLAQPQRPTFSIGSLLFENKRSRDSIQSARVRPTQQLAAEKHTPMASEHSCASSAAADLQDRLSRPQWDPNWTPKTFEDKRQGPYLSFHPRVSPEQIPEGCVPLQWAHQRLLAAVDATIRMGLNYWWV
jgi:hypothetical protein